MVDGEPVAAAGHGAAARLVALLIDRDREVGAVLAQRTRRREPGHPRSNNRKLHLLARLMTR